MRYSIVVLWKTQRKLMLTGMVCLVILVVLVTDYAFRGRVLVLFTPQPYNPAGISVPGYIGGYKVLAVFTSDKLACMNPGEIRLVLQAPESNLNEYLANSAPKGIQQELQQRGLNATVEIVGPGVTIDQIIAESSKWNQDMEKTGCIQLGPAELPQTTTKP